MSNNLWVGNLAAGVSDLELRKVFEKHGGVDVVMFNPSRNYAFVYLKNAVEAKKAKDCLQGVVVHGNQMKIEFAKPVGVILLGLCGYLLLLFLDLTICIVGNGMWLICLQTY